MTVKDTKDPQWFGHPEERMNHFRRIIDDTEGTWERALKQGIEGCARIIKSITGKDERAGKERMMFSARKHEYQEKLKDLYDISEED